MSEREGVGAVAIVPGMPFLLRLDVTTTSFRLHIDGRFVCAYAHRLSLDGGAQRAQFEQPGENLSPSGRQQPRIVRTSWRQRKHDKFSGGGVAPFGDQHAHFFSIFGSVLDQTGERGDAGERKSG